MNLLGRNLRIGALVSGGGTNLQAIVDKIASGELRDCEIVCVGSNNHDVYGLKRADNAGIPTFIPPYKALANLAKTSLARLNMGVPHDLDEERSLKEMGLLNTHENRVRLRILSTAEVELLSILEEYKVDLLICAGFDRLLSPYFHDRFQPNPLNPRVMNIHPAITPAYPGMHAYEKAWNKGAWHYSAFYE